MKIVPTIAVGAGIVGLLLTLRYFNNLRRSQKSTAVQIGGRVYRLTPEGIELVVTYNIQNPASSSMTMAIPLIKLSHKGAQLGTSSMSQVDIPDATKAPNKRIRIPANGETGVISTVVLLPYFKLIGVGANLVAILKDRIKGGSKVAKFDVEVNTTIFTPLGGQIAYDDKQVIGI